MSNTTNPRIEGVEEEKIYFTDRYSSFSVHYDSPYIIEIKSFSMVLYKSTRIRSVQGIKLRDILTNVMVANKWSWLPVTLTVTDAANYTCKTCINFYILLDRAGIVENISGGPVTKPVGLISTQAIYLSKLLTAEGIPVFCPDKSTCPNITVAISVKYYDKEINRIMTVYSEFVYNFVTEKGIEYVKMPKFAADVMQHLMLMSVSLSLNGEPLNKFKIIPQNPELSKGVSITYTNNFGVTLIAPHYGDFDIKDTVTAETAVLDGSYISVSRQFDAELTISDNNLDMYRKEIYDEIADSSSIFFEQLTGGTKLFITATPNKKEMTRHKGGAQELTITCKYAEKDIYNSIVF